MSTKKEVFERTLLYSCLLKEALKRLIIEIRENEDLFLRQERFAFPCLCTAAISGRGPKGMAEESLDVCSEAHAGVEGIAMLTACSLVSEGHSCHRDNFSPTWRAKGIT